MSNELTEQPLPADSRCPNCGATPTDGSIREHRLSTLGYAHDDIMLECSSCQNRWTHGVPVGEFDRPEMADDLRCGSCGNWMLVHRVWTGGVRIELKCPNCANFDRINRQSDANGCVLLGYPQITGRTDGCEPFGYPDREDD